MIEALAIVIMLAAAFGAGVAFCGILAQIPTKAQRVRHGAPEGPETEPQ